MLIEDQKEAIKELDLSEKNGKICVNSKEKRKSTIREWTSSNKYRTNYKNSF